MASMGEVWQAHKAAEQLSSTLAGLYEESGMDESADLTPEQAAPLRELHEQFLNAMSTVLT